MEKQQNRGKIACSVGILTFNSGESLRKCLESTSQFSELIICDGGSTDNTLEIAREFNCVILAQDSKFKHENNKISDFSGVRNQTLNAATNKWFLYVDSDEYLSMAVVDEIRTIIEDDKTDSPKIYDMPRKFSINNQLIECASVYPNYHTRFFHRDYVSFFRKEVHERIVGKEGIEKSKLSNYTVVPIVEDYLGISKKNLYYLNIENARCLCLRKNELLYAILFNIRSLLVRVIKVIKINFFCRGKHMPIRIEWLAAKYSFDLIVILFGLLFRFKDKS